MDREAKKETAIGIYKKISDRETKVKGLDIISLKAMLDKLESKREAVK